MPHELSRLPPRQQLVSPGKWPVVGELAARTDIAPWRLSVSGEVVRPLDASLEQIRAMPNVEPLVDIIA